MSRLEYMRLKIADIPQEVVDQYILAALASLQGYIYCKIIKGMYGLPQAGIMHKNSSRSNLENMAITKAR